jgi:hypothetical protein
MDDNQAAISARRRGGPAPIAFDVELEDGCVMTEAVNGGHGGSFETTPVVTP